MVGETQRVGRLRCVDRAPLAQLDDHDALAPAGTAVRFQAQRVGQRGAVAACRNCDLRRASRSAGRTSQLTGADPAFRAIGGVRGE
jgi:hypothetical protein